MLCSGGSQQIDLLQMNQSSWDIFENFLTDRRRMDLPDAIVNLLNVFEVGISEPKTAINPFFMNTNNELYGIPLELQEAFQKMSKQEEISLYCRHIEYLKTINMESLEKSYSKLAAQQEPFQVKTYFQSDSGTQLKATVVVNFKDRTLAVQVKDGDQIVFPLINYFARQIEKAGKRCLVFDRITPRPSPQQSGFVLRPSDDHFQQLQVKVQKAMDAILRENLLIKLRIHNSTPKTTTRDESSRETYYLNKGVLEDFNEFSKGIKTQQILTTDKKEIYNDSHKRIYNNNNSNIYYLDELFLCPKERLMAGLKLPSHLWNQMVKESAILEEASDDCDVIFEKYELNDILYEFVFLRENKSTSDEGRFLVKNVPNPDSTEGQNPKFDYALIRVLKLTEQASRLWIELKADDSVQSEIAITYLMQYSNIPDAINKAERKMTHVGPLRRGKSVEFTKEEHNETVYYNALEGQQHSLDNTENILQNEDMTKEMSEGEANLQTNQLQTLKLKHRTSIRSVIELTQEQECLQADHIVDPLPKLKVALLEKIHPLVSEWQRHESGALVCVNEKILGEQKKVVRHLISSFGRNILKNKDIFNISLPVSVCGKKSHLELIAHNYAYTPHLIEHCISSTPLERMKNIVAFIITVGITTVSSQKPFPPILGETFQGLIDGCPIYLEHLSQDPPVTRYLLQGRGYRIYGGVQPKVEISGLNSAKGFSERDNVLEYTGGKKVYMSYPGLSCKGFLFGDRECWFDCKNFAYDTHNDLFAEIIFGPKKSGFFGKSNGPLDYVSGQIHQVKPGFWSHFLKHNKKAFPSKDEIVSQVSSFEGLWTRSINFQDSGTFNFQQLKPFMMQPSPHKLPSDSSYRPDLASLQSEHPKESQQLKEAIEEEQRRDKTLRSTPQSNR